MFAYLHVSGSLFASACYHYFTIQNALFASQMYLKSFYKRNTELFFLYVLNDVIL